jgi:hypothetical protein
VPFRRHNKNPLAWLGSWTRGSFYWLPYESAVVLPSAIDPEIGLA